MRVKPGTPIQKNAETSALKIKNYCNCAATVLFLSNAWATSSVATVLIESPGMNARFAIRLWPIVMCVAKASQTAPTPSMNNTPKSQIKANSKTGL